VFRMLQAARFSFESHLECCPCGVCYGIAAECSTGGSCKGAWVFTVLG
jgi:hypothetical protein